jgi:hypothetical protein
VRDALIKALTKVDRPGDVYTAGDLALTMPGLVVEGLGTLRLPLGETQARELIGRCQQAPYGKGTQTLVDTTVRRVWELDPVHFQLSNPKWDQLIESIVGEVQEKLGLQERKLTAHLYKLLVYEKESFFLPHRDGEKLDRMVATLVVALPSEHTGGVLIISHDGHQHEITFTGAASGLELSYAAFYADCQHEVRPLASGFRLCLTYNVTLAKSRGRKGITAPSYESVVDELAEFLVGWRNDPNPQKLTVTLDHRYTRDGLTLDKLKGIDRSRADVLFEAAERADCMAHLALVTLWQQGSAEGDYDDFSYGRDRRYSWFHDDDDDDDEGEGDGYDDETGSDYEMGEIFEASLSADHWSDRKGKKVRFGEIRLEENEIVADAAIDDGDPSEEEFEGYTGNAGMTLERWYRRAAVVIWPRQEHFAVLCGAGTDASIAGLEPMVKRLKRASKARREIQRGECLDFATAIIDAWHPVRGRQPRNESDEIDRNVFPGLLCELDDPDLVRRFLSQVLSVDGEIQLDVTFVKFCKRHGWESGGAELMAVIRATRADTLVRNAQLVQMLCRQRDRNAERLVLCTRLCEGFVEALEAFDSQQADDDWRARRVDRAALLIALVGAMLAIDAQSPLLRLIDHALLCRDKYGLTDTHLAAIFALESRLAKLTAPSEAVSHWLLTCRQLLQGRTARAPGKPTDFRRADELSCKCADCSALSQFLANSEQPEIRFPLNKDRRQHLHGIIDSNRCDLTHVTERRGRPFTLVCTKTTASYARASNIYERDLKNLSRIMDLEKRSLLR